MVCIKVPCHMSFVSLTAAEVSSYQFICHQSVITAVFVQMLYTVVGFLKSIEVHHS